MRDTRPPLKKEIVRFASARPFEWVHTVMLEDFARSLGFTGSNASRRCRELVREGILEVRYNAQHCAEYKYRPILQRMQKPAAPVLQPTLV